MIIERRAEVFFWMYVCVFPTCTMLFHVLQIQSASVISSVSNWVSVH